MREKYDQLKQLRAEGKRKEGGGRHREGRMRSVRRGALMDVNKGERMLGRARRTKGLAQVSEKYSWMS